MILILDENRLILIKIKVVGENSVINSVSEYVDCGNGIIRNLVSKNIKVVIIKNQYELAVAYFLCCMEDSLNYCTKKDIIKEFRYWIKKNLLYFNNFFYETRYSYLMDINNKEIDFYKFLYLFDYDFGDNKPTKINFQDFNKDKGINIKDYYSSNSIKIVNKVFNSRFLFGDYKKCKSPNEMN